ncbi:MAG: outer membrane lipoprotein carrier protein LolA [Flavobacteriaceae bacterium]|nr:outer membrane lipoprotein carrier protein LolA [Flavobacteriaceae bacterium]
MKKYIVLVTLFLGIITFAQDALEAKKILDEVSTKIKSYESLYIEFSSSLDNNAENVHQITKGNTSLKGNLYVVNLLGVTTIFDGKKVYTINPEDEEVNITDPDEDIFTPAQFFSFYEQGYAFELDKTENLNGRELQYVKLSPIDSESEFKYVLLGIDSKTKHIQKIIQKGKNGTNYTLIITNFKSNLELSAKLFKFDKSKYEAKGYMINEL